MLEMLRARKEQLEKQGTKGFTLMEMLIVIAIIAILIAIAIPIFTAQLESARDSTSVANMRSAYAQAQTAYITGNSDTAAGVTVNKGADGKITSIEVANVKISSHQANNWSEVANDLPWKGLFTTNADGTVTTKPADEGKDKDNATIIFTYENDQISDVELP